MPHNLIHTKDYLLVVDDSEIKEGDWCFLGETSLFNAKIGRVNKNVISDNGKNGLNFKKIIAHLPLNDFPILEGVDLLPPLEDEVEELAEREYSEQSQSCDDDPNEFFNYTGYLKAGFINGYNKAKEKYKYTNEDMLTIRNNLVTLLPTGDVTAWDMIQAISKYTKWFDNYVESLSQPELPTAFECEIQYFYMSSEYYYGTEAGWVKFGESQYESIRKEIPTCPLKKVHKETTTPEGHTQWVGKYIY
jgi:hypothetical protein